VGGGDCGWVERGVGALLAGEGCGRGGWWLLLLCEGFGFESGFFLWGIRLDLDDRVRGSYHAPHLFWRERIWWKCAWLAGGPWWRRRCVRHVAMRVDTCMECTVQRMGQGMN